MKENFGYFLFSSWQHIANSGNGRRNSSNVVEYVDGTSDNDEIDTAPVEDAVVLTS